MTPQLKITRLDDNLSVPLTVAVDGVMMSEVCTRIDVEKGLDQFAHHFSFDVVGQTAIDGLAYGALVEIKRGSELLCTGFINRLRQPITADGATLSVEGRSRTADLVDCSATHKLGHWTNATPLAIIGDVCRPFGITVKAAPDAASTAAAKEVFGRFGLEYGETAFSAIDRACKVRGLLPVTQPDASILLVRKVAALDTSTAQRTIGRTRVLSHERSYDDSGLYSTYQTSVHLATPEDAADEIGAASGVVKRWRPLVLPPETHQSASSAKVRLQWEANIRRGRAERFTFTVLGSGWSDTESYVPGRQYVLPDLLSSADDLNGLVYSDEKLPASLLERATIQVTQTAVTTNLEFVNPLAYSLESDTTVNASGLTRAKKPKQVVHHRARKGLTR